MLKKKKPHKENDYPCFLPDRSVQRKIMATIVKTIEEAEKEALKIFEKELKEHNNLCEKILGFMTKVINELPEKKLDNMPKSRKVAIKLLTKIFNDLRCVVVLANHGYSVQSFSHAASIYEAAFTVVYIDNNENLAQQWLEYDNPCRPFRNAKVMTEEIFSKLGYPEQADNYYNGYRQLCWAKHQNPLYQQSRNRSHDGIDLINGPDISETSVQDAWFAIMQASAYILFAMDSFNVNHVPEEQNHAFRREIEELGKEIEELASEYQQSWDPQDPFPGKW